MGKIIDINHFSIKKQNPNLTFPFMPKINPKI